MAKEASFEGALSFASDLIKIPGLPARRVRGGAPGEVEACLRRRVGTTDAGLRYNVRTATELQRTFTGLEEEWRLFSPGFLMSPEHPAVRAAAGAVGRRSEGSGAANVRPWAFATDGGWSHGVHGIPTVGFAPGEERFAHTNRERLEVAEARWAFERYPHLIAAVQRAVAD